MTESKQPNKNEEGMSRRAFLKNTGLVAGGLVGGSLFGGLITNQVQKKDKNIVKDTANQTGESFEARIFFSRNEDFATLGSATERLLPETEIGPGAIALGVPYFIDKQLAGEWGTNAHDYMSGPFPFIEEVAEYEEKDVNQNKGGAESETRVPTPTPRYQTRMTRSAVFLEGIRALQRTAEENYDEAFQKLEPEQQDEILQLFEAGEVEMNGVSSSMFFDLLLSTTIEGAYADPVYGGNRNMDGWRMKEYPGPRMSYLADIDKEEFIVMEPENLRDYQGH